MHKSIPIEDIGYVILEHPQISISLPLLNALSENNTAIVVCGDNHMPKSMFMNLDSNHIQAETYKFQANAALPLKKNLWKQTIESKIRNQAALLEKMGKHSERLKPLYCNVKSGDSDNREGIASNIYWSELFGREFVRRRDGPPPNNLLNYGYSILRAAMTRALMGSGLFPAFGIHHCNRYNAFPLADDIMEPYRPYVDEQVYGLFLSGIVSITSEVKVSLLKILTSDTRFGKVLRPFDVALSVTTASLSKCFAGKVKKIAYPLFI